MRRFVEVALLVLSASLTLGACRQLAGYGPAAVDAGHAGELALVDLPGASRDGPNDGRDDTLTDVGSPDAPASSTVFVDDDWLLLPPGAEVFVGATIGTNAFATISEALLAAEAKMTITAIEVRAGIYNEKVNIKRGQLTLQGVTRPVLRQISTGGAVGESVVSVSAPNVTVVGFEIDSGGNGITVNCPQTNVTIRDNHVHHMVNVAGNQGVGILVWGACTNVVIRGNNVHDNDRQGIYLGSTNPTIIASDNKIRQNTVANNGRYTVGGVPGPDPYGIQVHFAERTEVQGNTISGQNRSYGTAPLGAGIWLSGRNNKVLDNDVSGCVDGIWVGLVQDSTTITGNTLHGNSRGLLFTPVWVGTAVATDNVFCGNAAFALRNNGVVTVDAQRCWWEDPAGANKAGQKTVGLIDTTNPLTTKPAKGPCSAP